MLRSEFEFYYKSRDYAAISEYKVDNAILLAAECTSQFSPLAETTPKPLLKVKGEILIERLIHQLIEADITEIYVVVGRHKAMFAYLEAKYGVHVIENPEHDARNNHSSIYAAREYLGNSYICSADNYFTESVFDPYVYASYHASVFMEGKTSQLCLSTAFNGRINGIKIGGTNAWCMKGHSYWDRKFSRQFIEILEAEYNHPAIHQMNWENVYMNHLDILTLFVRKYPDGIIRDFHTLDELCLLDTSYIPYRDSLKQKE